MNEPQPKLVAAFRLDQLFTIRPLIRTEMDTLKNHIAFAVEQKEYSRADNLVEKLRGLEECYKAVNKGIHAITGKYE